MTADPRGMVKVPLLSSEQTKYYGLLSEMQSLRTLRTDHSMRCVYIWVGLIGLYFGAHFIGNTDPKAVAFHRAIPWIAIILGLSFVLSDRFSFNQYRKIVHAGNRLSKKMGEDDDSFSLQDQRAGPFGITIIQWKLLGGLIAWGYVLGNQYFELHSYIVRWAAQIWAMLKPMFG